MNTVTLIPYKEGQDTLSLSAKMLPLAFDSAEGKYVKVLGLTADEVRIQLDEGGVFDIKSKMTNPDGSKLQPLTKLYVNEAGKVTHADLSGVKAVEKPRPQRSGSMTEISLSGIRG